MARQRFEVDTTPRDNRSYGEGYYGGYDVDTTTTYDPNGNPSTIIRGTNQENETNRYRGLGEAAANRGAYQVDFNRANADALAAMQARAQQEQAAKVLQSAAYGNAPSAAAIQGGQVAGNSLAASLRAGAGMRGPGAPGAYRAMLGQQQAAQLGGMSQFAAMRGAEMDAARGAYMGGVTGMRGQDYQGQGLLQRQAEAQAAAENFQRDLNQKAQMGYEQMGFDVNAAEMNAGLRRRSIQEQINEANRKASEAQTARAMQMGGAVVSGVGSLAGFASQAGQAAGTNGGQGPKKD